MGGDAKIFSRGETAEDLRKQCPTSIDFLREMAGHDFYPRYQERFTEAAAELERVREALTPFVEAAKYMHATAAKTCPPGELVIWADQTSGTQVIVADFHLAAEQAEKGG